MFIIILKNDTFLLLDFVKNLIKNDLLVLIENFGLYVQHAERLLKTSKMYLNMNIEKVSYYIINNMYTLFMQYIFFNRTSNAKFYQKFG